MASTIFHHWRDQFHSLPPSRQRWIRCGLFSLAAIVVFALGVALGHFGLPNGAETRAQRLATQNASLQSQAQSLQQQQRTAAAALAALRTSAAQRDDELQKLRQQQTFYSKLIGIDSGRSGLGVHSISLKRVAATDAWNFVATLVNTAKNADTARGKLTVAVEGIRDGKLTSIDWTELAEPDKQDGVAFAFKFFQQVHGSFMLPKGFVPNRITVTLHPRDGAPVTRKLNWSDARDDQPDSASSAP